MWSGFRDTILNKIPSAHFPHTVSPVGIFCLYTRSLFVKDIPLLYTQEITSTAESMMYNQCVSLQCARGGHSYSTRRTVRDWGQDAVKRSSRIFSTGQAVKRTFWVGQRSRPTFAQTNSYSNSYPTGYTHDFVYTVYLSSRGGWTRSRESPGIPISA